MSILTVSQLNNYISFKIKSDVNLKSILVEGEISNFTRHYKTGHLYFTLKDDASSIKAVMFSSSASHLKFELFNGMKVILSGSTEVYARDGVYQIIVNDVCPSGTGKLYLEYEQLKQKLLEKGYFDSEYKKNIPQFPHKVAVITSSSGAALHDIINVFTRRYPLCELLVFSAIVQGTEAVQSLCSAVVSADNSFADVIIIGRGGGSLEDLMAFNSEKLAECIFSCNTPVISAVGHETDTTICDLVADLRAPTPSAAAELASPDIDIYKDYLTSYNNKSFEKINKILEDNFYRYQTCLNRLKMLSPINIIDNSDKRLSESKCRLNSSFSEFIDKKVRFLSSKIDLLSSLSPLNVLSRGYSITFKDDKVITSANELIKDDTVKIRFSDSETEAVIK